MTTPINILVNGESILDYLDSASIKFSESSYCFSIDLSLSSDVLWSSFDPIANFGKLCIKAVIGDSVYEFLCEERNTSVPASGIAFTVWGRSAQAMLDQPYSKWINDEEEKVHPWQNGSTTVSSILSYVLNYCCSTEIKSSVPVHWNVDDFRIEEDSFSTSHSSPIEIIARLAGVIGAELIANPDGSLSINEYSVQEGVAVQEYNDLDHIVSLDDDIIYPAGYNSVVVTGYTNSSQSTSGYLSAVLQEDDLKGWEYGKNRKIRCYHYHPKHYGVLGSVLKGNLSIAQAGVEEFNEWVLLVWGEGNTQYPNSQGETIVKGGSAGTPLELRKVSYSVEYQDFNLASLIHKGDDPDSGVALFYFPDKSNSTEVSFDFYDPGNTDGDGDVDTADLYDYMLAWDEDTTQPALAGKNYPGRYTFRSYGAYWNINRYFDSLYNTLMVSGIFLEQITEVVEFSNGEGSLSKPYWGNMRYSWIGHIGSGILYNIHSCALKLSNNLEEYPFLSAKISYTTSYGRGYVNISSSYIGANFYVYARKKRKYDADGKPLAYEYLSISKSVENQDIVEKKEVYKDITLVVKDFATEVVIPNAAVSVDGSYVGSTDSNGAINISHVKVGDHTIRLVAQGYLDSDEDELANDTFTVSVT